MKLWLVRHARPVAVEVQALCYGRLEIEVDPAQTSELALTLAHQLPLGVHLRVSPRQRCEKLAQQLCKARPDLIGHIDPDLAEMDFGSWEGRTWDSLGAAALDAWVKDFGEHRPGGGESVNEVMRRVARALHHTQAASPADGQAVWITHAGVIRATHLLSQGIQNLRDARDWPSDSIAHGQVECLDLVQPGPGPTPVRAS